MVSDIRHVLKNQERGNGEHRPATVSIEHHLAPSPNAYLQL